MARVIEEIAFRCKRIETTTEFFGESLAKYGSKSCMVLSTSQQRILTTITDTVSSTAGIIAILGSTKRRSDFIAAKILSALEVLTATANNNSASFMVVVG